MKQPEVRPNVIVVITDDQGYGDLGCTGNPLVRTPNIDRFYRESVRLTDFHVGPTCAPTRAGLLTGHYANSTGVWHTIGGRSLLREGEWTLASALREAGYRTGIFGKWHLGDAYPYRPQDRGFETAIVHGGGGIGQTPDFWGNDYFDDTYLVNGEPKPFSGYCTDVWFAEALAFIERNREHPFFCYIATNAPHSPCNVEPGYYDLYKGEAPDERARFYGMITNIDDNFGSLRSRLREWNLEENTILVFMTDNGTACGCSVDGRGFVTDGYNAGIRGKKNSPYDGGHRVPFFIRWPSGGIDRGADVDRITANVDFMPTILDLCGVQPDRGRTFHGVSLKPLLFGRTEGWPDRVIVTDSQRLAQPVKWRQSAVMTDRWRLINGTELYDIKADPEQRRDIADSHPRIVERLREEYETWWEIVSQQFDEEIPIPLDAPDREEVCLTSHDWRIEDSHTPWNQGQIRAGMEANGYWEVKVERSGEYVFELRRWPKESPRPVTAGIENDDIAWRKDAIPQNMWSWYSGGRALPVREARLRVGAREYSAPIREGDHSVRFTVPLTAGRTHLQAEFTDGANLSIGAYYVYVRRLA